MNQEKIGKFIQKCRKDKKLTQEQLAERLGITDRAVSKWERGINLPDASLMVELSAILEISVNELLTGEIIKRENYMKKAEENLMNFKRREEELSQKLLNFEWIIGMMGTVSFIVLVFITMMVEIDYLAKILLLTLAFLLFLAGVLFAMKIEREIGYYECKYCHHQYIPKIFPFWFSMHIFRTRYLKCPNCHKYSWNKKIIIK